jgi:hypothetical protein
MAKNNESLNNSLFQLLRSRGYNPTLLGTDGKEIPVPDEAEVFQFHFIKDDKDYGPVTISIDGLNKLVIYYNDAIASSPSEEGHSEDTSWFTLLNHLKRFSQGHQLSFELKNTDHLKYDMAKRNNMKKIDEAAKWRQGYSASGHPAGHKHKSGEVGPIGGTFTNEPSGYDGDTKKVPVQKYRDKEDELSGRANTKLSTTGKPLLPRNAQKNLKGAIKQSAGKHGPVNPLPAGHDDTRQFIEGFGDAEGAEQVFKVVALNKSDALKKPKKLNVKASSTEEVFERLAINDWYALSINGVEVIAGKRLKQDVAEGLGDDFADMAKGMKNKDGSPRFANVRQGKPPVKPAGKATAPRAAEKGATSPADWYDQASGGRRYTGDSKVPTGTMVEGSGPKEKQKRPFQSLDQMRDTAKQKSEKNKQDKKASAAEKIGKKQVEEGYYATGRKSSYSDAVPQVKIILQHSRQLEEGERRYRAIERIFVENAAGERFLLDTTKPGLARVYARHIAEGGTPYDEQGKHIHSLCEEYTKMAGFVRATRNGQFNESTQSLVNEGVNHYNNLRETLHKMAGRRGYNAYFESWTPTLTEDEDSTDLSEMFASTELDPRIESVMPILRKLNKNITEVDHSAELAEWADDVIDESLGLAEVSNDLLGRYKKKAGKEASGLDTFANAVAKKGEDPAYSRAADWATKRANKRFSGIVKATNKEFANDAKPVEEGDGLESNNPEGIPEATNPRQAERDRRNAIMTRAAMPNEPKQTQAHFPDTKQGAVASLSKNANPRFVKQMDLPNCVVHADPQVEGVWAIDNYTTGVRVIVYLAGYRGPMGDIRGPYDDFEEGQIPKREMMRHQRNDQAQNDVEDEMMENRDELDNQSRGLLAPGGILKKLKKDLRYALDSGLSSEQEVARLRAKIAELEGRKQGKVSEALVGSNSDMAKYTHPDIENESFKVGDKVIKTFGDGTKAEGKLTKQARTRTGADVFYFKPTSPMGSRWVGWCNVADLTKKSIEEDLGPEQKKVGQAGPTDKAPLRGKLVGACESVDHLAHIVKLSKG